MHIVSGSETDSEFIREFEEMLGDRAAADKFAASMDDMILYLEDLDPVKCPPDYIYPREDVEAWVYNHGKITELVFVKTDQR